MRVTPLILNVRLVEPFILPLTYGPGGVTRAYARQDIESGSDCNPVHRPLFGNIHHSQVKHFQSAVTSWKQQFCLRYFVQLADDAVLGLGALILFARHLRTSFLLFGLILTAMYTAFFTICPSLRIWYIQKYYGVYSTQPHLGHTNPFGKRSRNNSALQASSLL